MADLVVKVGSGSVAGVQKLTNKEQVVAMYKEKLSNDRNWAIAGLMRVYSNQTADEQEVGGVRVHNGVGFTPVDAEFLTSLAQQYQKRGTLSEKQVACLFKKMPKYARQLMNYSLSAGTMVKEGGCYKIVKASK